MGAVSVRDRVLKESSETGITHFMRLMVRLFVLACLGVFCLGLPGTVLGDEAHRRDLIRDSKRVVFLGDSITYGGNYVANFITWAEVEFPGKEIDWINVGLASETVSGLSEKGHAGGRFPRPDLRERLDRVLAATKPDLVFACYGMNCGIYLELDEGRFGKYRDGSIWLKEKVEKAGAKIVFLTPPCFDKLRNPKKAYYTSVLAEYSKWLVERRKDGWMVVDVNSAMTTSIEKRRETDATFTVQKDAVHPNKQGHWMMAQPMIRWFGDTKAADAVSVEAMLRAKGKDPKIAQLCTQRAALLRNAWLSKTGHKRPGVPKGKPLEEAQKLAAEMTAGIDELVK